MAGEFGHIQIPMPGLLVEGQPVPQCNCGLYGDVESIASLTGIRKNLLPFWLTQYPDHPLNDMPIEQAAKAVRGYGVDGDEMALKIFDQQAQHGHVALHIQRLQPRRVPFALLHRCFGSPWHSGQNRPVGHRIPTRVVRQITQPAHINPTH